MGAHVSGFRIPGTRARLLQHRVLEEHPAEVEPVVVDAEDEPVAGGGGGVLDDVVHLADTGADRGWGGWVGVRG